jgi:4-amino-4-deoxy-L-arabinose transferase-like glycosyltransferase
MAQSFAPGKEVTVIYIVSKDISQRQFTFALISTALSAAVLYLALAICSCKFSRAEVFFAECSREMLDVHNYVTPLYHMQPFFDKPILVYWLIIGMFKIFGISHWAARLPSIAAALVAVTVTGLTTKMLFGRRAGVMAAAMLASSFMFLSFAASCMSDMLLLLFDLLALVCAYTGTQTEQKRALFWWLSSLSMGIGFMIKGPVAVVLPSASVLIFLQATGQLKKLKVSYFVVAAITIAIVASPWFYAAYKQNGLGALTWFFIRENLGRFAGSTYDAHRPFWYMITTFFLGFAPWSLLIPFALAKFIAERGSIASYAETFVREDAGYTRNGALVESGGDTLWQRQLFFWLWIATAVGFFCFSRGKCDYYSLPAYPAAAILCAYYLDRQISQNPRAIQMLFASFAVAFLLSAVGSVFILKSIAGDDPMLWLLTPSVLFVAAVIIGLQSYKEQLLSAYAATVLGILAAITAFMLQIMPKIVALQPMSKYASMIAATPVKTKILLEGSLYHWIDELSFQTGRHPKAVDDTTKLENLINQEDSVIVIVPQTTFDRFDEKTRGKLKILCKDYVITHKLTPGYAFERKGHLLDPIPVIVAAKVNK